MKMGEIGIFLSHYNIWKEVISSLNKIWWKQCHFCFNELEQIVERRLERSIIFEDDIHFASNFRNKMIELVKEADASVPDWDLM